MNPTFDQHGINHATVAISREMTPQGGKRHADADTLFFGGSRPTPAEQTELVNFGLRKNYKLVFASFDPANPQAGPLAFDVVVTDGLDQSIGLTGGRLWKRDRRSPAILVFGELNAIIKMSAKGRLIVREMTGRYHDQGYDYALEAVLARAARKPGHVPVVAPIGTLVTVLDVKTMAATFEAAE